MTNSKKAENSSRNKKSQKATGNLSKSIQSFQKRWNVRWDEKTSFTQSINRLVYLIDKYLLSTNLLNHNTHNQYAYYCGFPMPYTMASFMFNQVPVQQNESIIINNILNSQSSVQLAWHLQNLFLALKDSKTERNPEAEIFIFAFLSDFKDVLESAPSMKISFSKTQDEIIIYPAGADLLDEDLINGNLLWLQEYPESLKALEQSLSIYMAGDKPKFRNLIDNLRVSVEQLLRAVLKNSKSLENQSKELDVWLEKHGVHKQIRNLYGQFLFGPYATLQNDVAKHGDTELLPDEIEYLIYQTGTFLRLILQLDRSKA
jgi:hypothetical protein